MVETARAADLALQTPAGVSSPRDLGAIRSLLERPEYLAEAVNALAVGVRASRAFAQACNISISIASERFRAARRLGSIVPVGGRSLPREGIGYTLNASKTQP